MLKFVESTALQKTKLNVCACITELLYICMYVAVRIRSYLYIVRIYCSTVIRIAIVIIIGFIIGDGLSS